ncbi:sugar transferase [Marinilabiliaceae bacterium ANBcel2]|nr:sugar transferase [Marinilabiliaceae bacterium ANBcel2]
MRISMKRLFDICLSLLLLFIFLPLMVLIALFIYVDDGLPLLFRQKRIGKNRLPFYICKFRSMKVLKGSENGCFDAGSSLRVTKSGRFLRKTKLDELPQLFNVIRGDMSLVGPRPEVSQWVNSYPARWSVVLAVRPGITDVASLKFKNEEDLLAAAEDPVEMYRNTILPRKLDLYEEYVQNHSFSSDLLILIKTFFALFFNFSKRG